MISAQEEKTEIFKANCSGQTDSHQKENRLQKKAASALMRPFNDIYGKVIE